MQYHIFGDTGGHYKQLKAGLEAIGYDATTNKLPKDVTVIHLGDLIHKGPLSEAILFMIDRIMDANPGQWIQIMGNHESQYTKDAPFFWGNVIDVEGRAILNKWFNEGRIKVAYALPASATFHNLTLSARDYPVADKSILFTHAGLPELFWSKYIRPHMGELLGDTIFDPYDAEHVAEFLNTMPLKIATNPGVMLGGDTYRRPVGPVWASGVDELWKSWHKSQQEEPFHQVHGHTYPFTFGMNVWYPAIPKEFKQASKVNTERKTTVTRVAGSIHVAVDPSYSKTAPLEAQPALLVTV